MVRFRNGNSENEHITLYQTFTVKVDGVYTFSADLIREDGSKINVSLSAGGQSVSNSSAGTWQNKSFNVTLAAGQQVTVTLKFENKATSGDNKCRAGADNVKIEYVENKTLVNLVAKADEYFPSLEAGGLRDAIDEAKATKDNYENTDAYQTRLVNAVAGLRAAVKAQKTVDANMTLAIINPDFEDNGVKVTNPTGWNQTVHGKDDGTRNSAVTNMTGWYYNAYQEWWNTSIDIKQTVTGLPIGQYTLSAVLSAWSGCTVNLTGNGMTSSINGSGDNKGEATSVTCYVTDGTLDIKVNGGVKDGGTFFKCDNFTLTYKGVKPVLANVIATATTLANTNVGSGVFQIPSSYAETLSEAIGTAQGVYDNADATYDEVVSEIGTLNAAIETFNNAVLNEPTNGQLFNVILTSNGYTYDQKAMTYIANGRNDAGLYTIEYKAAANTNMAQAFTFTRVSGNNYKMSQIDADGNVRYLSTAVPYSGNTSQIRTVTEANNALLVTIIPTTTEGVWNLKNTEADALIGSQDVGVYTVSSNNNFNIVETTKPSITINTTVAGWGTTMLPFAVAALPDGVKAYTCAAVKEGDYLDLVAVDALEANKPYIIEGAWNATLTGDAQGIALTCTEGLLTGVYANTLAPVGSYVLQNHAGEIGFYQVADGKQPTVGANRAYLTDSPLQAAPRAFFFDDDDATGIDAIGTLTSGQYDAIYTGNGVKVKSLQKGMNIVVKGSKSYKIFVK